MIIQHVIAAQNANLQCKINNKKRAKDTEKLSSGYRINRASDDASGLAISEKMRAQIRGLNRASENAQEGISLVQTAEGAMQESQNILHRMRELSVQAANDTNTREDRECIKQELDQLAEELDRIANGTEYNTMKLLDGSYTLHANDLKTKFQERLKSTWLQDALTRINDCLGIGPNENIIMSVKFSSMGAGTVAAMGSGFGSNRFSLYVNTDFIEQYDMSDFDSSSGPYAGGMLVDRVMTHEITHAIMMHNCSPAIEDIPMWFTEGLAEAVHGNNRWTETVDKVAAAMSGFSNSVSGTNAYSMGYYAVSYMAYNTIAGTFKDFMQDMGSGLTFDELLKKYYGVENGDEFATMITDMVANEPGTFVAACHITLQDGLEDCLGDWDMPEKNVIPNLGGGLPIEHSVEKLLLGGKVWTVHWDEPNSSGERIKLQVGANSGQEMDFCIGDMRRKVLIGLDDIDVSTHDAASVEISRFDNAIRTVSNYRSYLGAVQNRLEHTIARLDNYSENLTESESKIRDTDMADLMTNYAKNNILCQSAQSMLVQANNINQGVLSLLQ
ncbi:MAG: flagellinolysin [Lachnospiraceae bacterium]|nr:flagellinolysin [Lachnospiraceae bacterium]